jgi:hypothetical protein
MGFELGAYTLSHFCDYFFKIGSGLLNNVSGLALNHNPADLCLLSSWDYRCESLAPDLIF